MGTTDGSSREPLYPPLSLVSLASSSGATSPPRRAARAAPSNMAVLAEGEGEVGPSGSPEGLRSLHFAAVMPDLPFLPFCALLGSLGLGCVAFVGAWCQHWRGGFAWDGSARMFNWHPVLMVTGMVVLYGAAALVYRLPPAWRGPKLPWKILHSTLALTAFILAVLGLVAVFNFHNASGTPNMYSLHSWLGLATILLFSCQWVAGFCAFLLPYAPIWIRALYKPVHVFFGSTILMLSMASCVSGINEKLFFSLKNGTASVPYKLLPPEAVFANILGLLIILFGVLVLCALAKPSWKRPEADSLDTHQPLLGAEH